MERARTELMRSLGFGKNRIFNDGVMFVVRDVQIKYLGSAVLDDVIQVTAEPLEVRGARFIVRQQVWRSGELLADAKVECASVARSSQTPIRMPADIRDQLTALINKE
jgi:YbgC/YbaW family acyl-CoA thioester hydrolase